MKVVVIKSEVKSEKLVDVAFDVGKGKLNCIFDAGNLRFSDELRNSTISIRGKLKSYMEQAWKHGMDGIRVLAEPSGGYEKALLKTAHRLGCRTAYVSGEAASKFRMVVHGDPGKTDERDPLPLLGVAARGKLLTHRVLPADYELLREINQEYGRVSGRRVEVRCEIHGLLVRLFPDFPMGSDFLYEAAGLAVVREYGWNPKQIASGGEERFKRCIKEANPRVRNSSIAGIWSAALESCELHDGGGAMEFLTKRVLWLFEEFFRLNGRQAELRAQLEEVYLRLRKDDQRLPLRADKVVKTYMLARIVAETGPLSDFKAIQQLYRFAGINLCERKSGKYKGKTKISRKGRVSLRCVLGRAILPLARKGGLYGAQHHVPGGGTKKGMGMAALMRKFLKMLFGWYKSGCGFDLGRVFTSASQYAVKAA